MSKYSDKLKDPRWQKKRLEVLELRGWACEVCCDKESPLHVHHSFYIKGKQPWEYETTWLRVLCSDCHDNEHHNAEEHLKFQINFLREAHGFLFHEISWLLYNGYGVLTK